jgi:PPK2 family polyphosphate:nucleotide phosphotransferase
MKINLSTISSEAPKDLDKDLYKQKCEELEVEIDLMQEKLYAQGKKSVLVIFQGMDGSGKDGAMKKVLGRLNPQGVVVTSFKKPTPEELSHDFLWRVHKNVPAKGMIGVFNRSHYEDVLVTRVLGLCSDQEAEKRFLHINAFEQLLEQTGTKVLKFFLHLGKEKQKEKFIERLEDPEKHWKYNSEDWKTNEKYDTYLSYYQEVIDNCNNPEWTIVPADNNWYKEYLIAKKIHETMSAMELSYPPLAKEFEADRLKYLGK